MVMLYDSIMLDDTQLIFFGTIFPSIFCIAQCISDESSNKKKLMGEKVNED